MLIWASGTALRAMRRGVVDDLVPLVGGRAGDEGDQRLVADVVDLVRHARLDVDEVARLVEHLLPEPLAEGVPDPALHDEEHHLEAVVDVGVGDRAGRHGGDVDRELPRAGVLAGKPLQVLDAVPGPLAPPAAQHRDAPEVLDRAHLHLARALRPGRHLPLLAVVRYTSVISSTRSLSTTFSGPNSVASTSGCPRIAAP